MDGGRTSERGDRDSGSGTTTSLKSRSSDTCSQQNISMNSLNEGVILVYNYTSKDYVKFPRTLNCEEICMAMCRHLCIRPVVQLLFGICEHRESHAKSKSSSNSNTNSNKIGFWSLPGDLLYSELRYCFRIRYRMPDLENQLRFIDPKSFNYLYYQMRYDMVHEQISEIRYPEHKDEVLGLAVLDMRIALEVEQSSAESIQKAYKTYLPRSLWNNHGLFARSHIHSAFQKLKDSVLPSAEFKYHYISFVCSLAPTYMMEQYRAIVDELPCDNDHTFQLGMGTYPQIGTPSTSSSSHVASISGGSIRTNTLSNGTISTTTLSTLANGGSCNGIASETASGTTSTSASNTKSSRKTKNQRQKKITDAPKGFDVFVRLFPHDSADPGLKIAQVTSTPKWSLVALTENIIMISPSVKDLKVSLEIVGMCRCYDMYFKTEQEMKSFVSYLGIYKRLTDIWMRDICQLYKTPSLVELKELFCHGPIGGPYSLVKLHERGNKCGAYIIRQCDREYYTYYIDINMKSAPTRVDNNRRFITETFKILRDEKQEKQWILVLPCGIQNAYATLQDLALSIHADGQERQCIPPSLHDTYQLLSLCLPKNMKNKKTNIQLTDADLGRCNPQMFSPLKDLQCYPGTMEISNDNIMYTMRGDWIQKGSIKDVPVTLKILRSEGDYTEFIKMTGRWGFIQSPQCLKLYGITLASPLTMVMEYSNYGPLDRFLKFGMKIELPSLVKLLRGFAHGIHYLTEYGIYHNFIRCSNLYVTEFKSPNFVAKIGDPGYPRPYQESDSAWIPCTFYNNLEEAKQNRSTQFWAFATTVYEIFSRCNADLRQKTQANLIQNRTHFGNILEDLDSKICPSEISDIIMDGWSDNEDLQFQIQMILTRIQIVLDRYTENSDEDCDTIPDPNVINRYPDTWHYDENWGDVENNVPYSFDYTNFPCVIDLLDCKVRYNRKNDEIGQGRYGKVFKGWLNDDKGTSEMVAIKFLHNQNGDFYHEKSIMQNLIHPNVVKFKYWAPNCKAIIMEYLSCSFETFLRSNPSTPRKVLESYALDIAKGMAYLAENKIVHRDLAARNVLVDQVMNRVKISDFGLSQRIDLKGYYIAVTVRELPIKWYAPEAIRYQKHSLYSDIWSYGVTLYETFTRGASPDLIPIPKTSDELVSRLEAGERLSRPEPANACADFIYNDIMMACWKIEPKERPTFKTIIEIFDRETDIGKTVSESSQHQHQQQQHQQQLRFFNQVNGPTTQHNDNNDNDHSFRSSFKSN